MKPTESSREKMLRKRNSSSTIRVAMVDDDRAVLASWQQILLSFPEFECSTVYSNPLSNRETDVIDLSAEALPDKNIADRLNVSENRLKKIKRSLYAKWNVHSRSEAILKRLFHG